MAMAQENEAHPETPNTFGAELRRLRRRSDMTLEALAEVSGVSTRAISGLERGQNLGPQRRTVTALADGLGLGEVERDALEELAKAGRPRPVTAPAGWCVPPRPVTDFTGRGAELRRIAEAADRPGTAATVVLLSGPGGIGKTTLAVEAGRRLAEARGVELLHVQLRGLDVEPVDPGVALFRLLRALGVGNRDMPDDVDGRSGQLRTLLEQRPAVVVLDNARDEEQVRPLLPGDGAGTVLITSRRLLTGLQTVERLPVPVLGTDDALALLRVDRRRHRRPARRRVAGPGPDVRRTAARAAHHRQPPGQPARVDGAGLAERLADSERRLERINAGDLQITAAFAMSYDQLSPDAQRLCRRLALVPGPDFDAALASVLIGASVHDAEDLLDELHELGLLDQVDGLRYGFHDLIRLFAGDRLAAEEADAERVALTRTMAEWLLGVTAAAGPWFDPAHGGPRRRTGGTPSTSPRPRPPRRGCVRVGQLVRRGPDRRRAGVGRPGRRHRRRPALVLEPVAPVAALARAVLLAAAAAQRMGDPVARARQLYNLSWARAQRDEIDLALTAALDAGRIAEEAGARRRAGVGPPLRGPRADDDRPVRRHSPTPSRRRQLFARVGDWTGQTTVLMAGRDHPGRPRATRRRHREAPDGLGPRPASRRAAQAWQTIADILLISGDYYLGAAYEAIEDSGAAEAAYRAGRRRRGPGRHDAAPGPRRGQAGAAAAPAGRPGEATRTLETARDRFLAVEASAEVARGRRVAEGVGWRRQLLTSTTRTVQRATRRWCTVQHVAGAGVAEKPPEPPRARAPSSGMCELVRGYCDSSEGLPRRTAGGGGEFVPGRVFDQQRDVGPHLAAVEVAVRVLHDLRHIRDRNATEDRGQPCRHGLDLCFFPGLVGGCHNEPPHRSSRR